MSVSLDMYAPSFAAFIDDPCKMFCGVHDTTCQGLRGLSVVDAPKMLTAGMLQCRNNLEQRETNAKPVPSEVDVQIPEDNLGFKLACLKPAEGPADVVSRYNRFHPDVPLQQVCAIRDAHKLHQQDEQWIIDADTPRCCLVNCTSPTEAPPRYWRWE